MFFSEGWRNLPFFYIYENMAFIDLVIQDFNEGDYDLLETSFNGDANAFFNYANKKGKIELEKSEIDLTRPRGFSLPKDLWLLLNLIRVRIHQRLTSQAQIHQSSTSNFTNSSLQKAGPFL